jgi:hypothetical protein
VQSQQDHRFPHGAFYFLKPGHLDKIGGPQVDALLAAAHELPAGDLQIELLRLGGAIGDVEEWTAAYPNRSAEFTFNVCTRWSDGAGTEEQMAWARKTHAALLHVGPEGRISTSWESTLRIWRRCSVQRSSRSCEWSRASTTPTMSFGRRFISFPRL